MKQIKYLLIITLIAMGTQAMGQQPYSITKDDEGNLVYNGRITFTDLDKEPAFGWMKSGEVTYDAAPASISYLHTFLPAYDMVVFMGTWCDDSHNLVPRLENVLLAAGYPLTNVRMYATDYQKATTGGEQKQYAITLVPTIILLQKGREAGRITESVQKSIEEDLAAIISKDIAANAGH